jgi:hypothetical protein
MNAKKLKVLHILYEIKFSGAEVMLNLASDYLQKKGISLYALNTSDKLGDYADVMQKNGYQIFHIPISNRLKFIIHLSISTFLVVLFQNLKCGSILSFRAFGEKSIN